MTFPPDKPKRPVPPQLKPWKPGQSGNPRGRRTGVEAEVKAIEQKLRDLVDYDAIAHALQDMVLGERLPKPTKIKGVLVTRKRPRDKGVVRVAAAKVLYERDLGSVRELEPAIDLGRLGEMTDAELERMIVTEMARAITPDQLRMLVEQKYGPDAMKRLVAPIDTTATEVLSTPPTEENHE